MNQNNSETYYIGECLSLIEKKWQRGNSAEWKSYDFEKLSDDILDATGVSLSVSTLKRLFGKVSYNNLPSLHTLNTIARFAGFEDWNAFKRQGIPAPIAASTTAAIPAAPPPLPVTTTFAPKRPIRWWPIPATLFALAIAAYFLLSSKRPQKPAPDPTAYSFSADKILTEGVPNSVVFHYDASASPSDSIYIVQSWDMSRKTLVPKTGHEHSSIYYNPGYFNAKLVIDNQIVRTHDIMITSNGWLALAATKTKMPVYFKKQDYQQKEGTVGIDTNVLAKYNLPLYPEAPAIRFFYMKDMGSLRDDNFTFETTLRNDFNTGTGACQRVEVLIQCKNDVFIIPLSARACIGDLQLFAAGIGINSKGADLSGFGCDLTQWTTLKVTATHKHVQFTVNGHPAYTLDFLNTPEDIVGVQYRFTGLGAIKDTRFTDSTGHFIVLK